MADVHSTAIVYIVTHQGSGKQYVGQSRRSLAVRRYEHIRDAMERRNYSRVFCRAIRKHGEDAFAWQALSFRDISHDHLNQIECDLIRLLDTRVPNGYNLEGGGSKPEVHAETRALLSAANRGVKRSPDAIAKTAAANRGRKNTPESRARMSVAAKGHTRWTPEARSKLSATNTGRKLKPETVAKMIGHPTSAETRAKLSARFKGRVITQESKDKMRAAQLGKKQSAETKEKRASALRGRKRPPEVVAKIRAARWGITPGTLLCA